MTGNTHHQGVPRANIDPIRDDATARRLIELAATQPMRNETIVMLLDDSRCGIGIFVVSGTHDNQSVIEVVDCIASAASRHEDLDGVFIASVRTASAREDADIDRWFEMSHLAEEAGIELVEWFIVDDTGAMTCPRDDVGAPPRW